jgi:hypothetical protein
MAEGSNPTRPTRAIETLSEMILAGFYAWNFPEYVLLWFDSHMYYQHIEPALRRGFCSLYNRGMVQENLAFTGYFGGKNVILITGFGHASWNLLGLLVCIV